MLLALITTPAWAWPPQYGAEFTFTNSELMEEKGYKITSATIDKWAANMRARCKRTHDCKVTKGIDKSNMTAYTVTYKDGWWYRVSSDPGVVEVQTKPSTLVELKKNRSRMTGDIFKIAKTLKIEPHEIVGGGHLNIGMLSAFADDPHLFADFLVDFANHPELPEGAIDYGDIVNAPALADQGKKIMKLFDEVITDFRKGKIAHDPVALATAVERRVYSKTPSTDGLYNLKYQAMNLRTIVNEEVPTEEKRAEIRRVRAQLDADEFILECELFEARMNYLKKLRKAGKPVKFVFPESITGPEKGVPAFYKFVIECGEKWEDYRGLMADHWQTFKFTPSCVKALSKKTSKDGK